MKEKDDLKDKLIKLIISNVIGFSIIFVVCGIFIFLMVRNITYSGVDTELLRSKDLLLSINNTVDTEFGFFDINTKKDIKASILKENIDREIGRRLVNPNVIIIRRDNDGNIINQDELGRLEEYVGEITFNNSNLDKIYEISLTDEGYAYRGINFEINTLTTKYGQLLINIDAQKSLVNAYFVIISLAIIVGMVLSIIVSYILSKRTVKPLKENIEKQIEFVQNASHELRTPLTIIQAKQELLLQEPNARIIDKSEDISLTLNETKRLSTLIKDLMMLSRADNNKISINKENVNIDEYIKNVLTPYIEVAEIENKTIELDLNFKEDIDVDTNKIYELLIILLDNAVKYTEENDLIKVKTYAKDNKFVLEVQDTGIGVSEEGLERIFERFYREDKARSRETGGSGLGLSIADFIVTKHGGTIKAAHNEPKGTIFIVRLPR
ncbi:MAG: GHKL domain-containing protein [Clostridia bacterium]|nr:GHKL domain-containing protein [Clostridia bacterium]